ncbi:MAG: multidrug efflux RND transporter permease subunit [Candidatus Omnitrophica bacterium]|nr:multidrug efflux RND transporter permease subunit [Candidatus Omnitrophota bacterium]
MISAFFIERPILANVIALVTIIIGLVFYSRLPVAQYPQITPPTIQISARYPGGNAEVVAATIGIPIEQAVNGVEGAMYMSSTSGSDGSYTLTITFNVGTDLNAALTQVQNLVNTSLAQLPAGVQQQGLTVKKVSPNILLVISLYADDDRFDDIYLSNYALIHLQNPLARLPGVGQVAIRGAGSYSMRIWLDPQRMQMYSLTPTDVITAIQQQNIQVLTGQLGAPPAPRNQTYQLTITTLGRLTEGKQFENIIIKTVPGPGTQVVRLRDIARVELSQQSYSNFARFTGHKAALIPVFALPDANALSVADHVYKAMQDISLEFPEGLKYGIRYDTTKFVRQAISSVYQTLFIAGLLVLIVIFLFLQSFRAMLVPATTVPVTIIGTFIAMAAMGFTINLMTLFALILAIGIVVDDAIIIVESSSYYIEKGLKPKDATIKAMDELVGPIMGITLALVAVFLPAAFFPGITGQIFRQFSLVITSTAVISALNAVTLKPVQCSLWLRPRQEKSTNHFYRWFNLRFQQITDKYIMIVSSMIRRPTVYFGIFIVIIVIAFSGFIHRPTGFLPTEDQGYGILVTRLPEGASQPRTEAVANKINAILKTTPGVEFWVVIGGLSILDNANVSNASTTFVVYKDWKERGQALGQDKIIAHINRELASFQEAQSFMVIPPPIRGLGQTGGFQLMAEDQNSLGLSELKHATDALVQAANSSPVMKGVTSTFNINSPQIFLDIDRTKAEALQVPLSNVFDTLQGYLGSAFVNLFNKYNQVFQVYVQADNKYRLQTKDITNLHVRNLQGEMVPLGAILNVKSVQGPELISRYNLYPSAAIFGTAAPGYSSGQALQTIETLANTTLPRGIGYEWTSTSFQEKQVGNQAYLIYLLSIILVYLVLAALYESWTAPAAVILVVPVSIVGVLIALWIRGYDNNLYTQVGLVLMIALASKNAILIVEFARELHHSGMTAAEAAIEATRRRFRPIVMTSFAFILGVAPLVFAFGAGSASQRAIGTVVFGGMISSTLLAIPFVPVFYVLMQRFSKPSFAHRGIQTRPADNVPRPKA